MNRDTVRLPVALLLEPLLTEIALEVPHVRVCQGVVFDVRRSNRGVTAEPTEVKRTARGSTEPAPQGPAAVRRGDAILKFQRNRFAIREEAQGKQ